MSAVKKIIDVCTQSCICMWKTAEKSACEVSWLLLSPVVRLYESVDFLAVFPKLVLWFEGNPCVRRIQLKRSKATIVFNLCLRLVRELPG